MKVYGERILNSNLRFVFTAEEPLSTADALYVEMLNETASGAKKGGNSSLADVVAILSPLVGGGEVKVTIEQIEDSN